MLRQAATMAKIVAGLPIGGGGRCSPGPGVDVGPGHGVILTFNWPRSQPYQQQSDW